jgi:hypothetical protein
MLETSTGSGPYAEQDRNTFGAQAFEGFGGYLAARCRDENHLGAAERPKRRARIGGGAIDEMMSPELFCQIALVGTARNRCNLKAHVPRILHTEVTEPTDAEDRNKITGFSWRVPQRAERRQPRTEQWRGVR